MSQTARMILVCTLALGANAQHQQIPESQILKYDRQQLTLADFPAKGYVLDIGGGGEGVIGQMKPSQVVAIDVIKRELEQAPPGPLKIVMDARDLKFLDDSFATATSFCSLMYVAESDQEKVFGEIFRVLEPGGRFLIWEGTVPAKSGELQYALFRLNIILPGKKDISTGYGVPMGREIHDTAYFARLARNTGFELASQSAQGRMFLLELKKPAR